jgi:hypothetical protein
MLDRISIRLYVKENTEIFEIISTQDNTLVSRFTFPLGRTFVDLYHSDFKSFNKLMGDTNLILRHIRDNDISTSELFKISDNETESAIIEHRKKNGLNDNISKLKDIADELPNYHVYYYVFKKYLDNLLYDFTINNKRIRNYKHLSHVRHDVPKHNRLIKFLVDECFDINIPDKVKLEERKKHFYSDEKYYDVKYDFREFEFTVPDAKYSFYPEKMFEYSNFENNELKLHPEIYVQSLNDIINFLTIHLFENEVKFNTCKNCGKYFVLEGHKSIEYCDRPVDNTGRTCKDVGAMATYRNKKNDDPIFKAYNKSYKTKNARIRYGKITREQFKVWSKNARAMRDKAYNDEITYEHLVAWLNTDLGFEEELTLY